MPRANRDQAVSTERRRRFFVDPQVQGALIRQSVYHWVWASATFALITFVYRVFPALLSGANRESGRIWYHFGPFMVASAVLFPIVVFSSIRFSNRFAGPMVRVRRTLKQLARGETTPIRAFRKNDFWSDTADDLNEIAALLREARPPASPAPNIIEQNISIEAGMESLDAQPTSLC